MAPAVHVAWSEVALCLGEGVSTVGIEHRTHGVGLLNLVDFFNKLHFLVGIFVVVEPDNCQHCDSNSNRYLHCFLHFFL